MRRLSRDGSLIEEKADLYHDRTILLQVERAEFDRKGEVSLRGSYLKISPGDRPEKPRRTFYPVISAPGGFGQAQGADVVLPVFPAVVIPFPVLEHGLRAVEHSKVTDISSPPPGKRFYAYPDIVRDLLLGLGPKGSEGKDQKKEPSKMFHVVVAL